MKQGIATIRCGGRSVSEIIDLEEEEEHFNDSYHPDETLTFDHWTRSVKVDDINIVNGNHLLFGYVECLFQSDASPVMFLKGDEPWSYEFLKEE